MKAFKYNLGDLRQRQSLPLESKILLAKQRIREWYEHYEGNVYVSFSGGKDSTVLLDLVRQEYPEVPAVFVDTGLEYPEIREFVKKTKGVVWLKPAMDFRQVILEYGYPIGSKLISKKVSEYHRGCEAAKLYCERKAIGPAGTMSRYVLGKRWQCLLNAPFKVSHKCCDVMKKNPLHNYEKQEGRKPYIGLLAEESLFREKSWMQNGCNAFESDIKQSRPLMTWKESDVLQYIDTYGITIAPVYGKIVQDGYGKYSIPSGCRRTGCMYCAYGVTMDGFPNRYQELQVTHPRIYDYIMKPLNKGGLGFKEVLEYCGIPYWQGIQITIDDLLNQEWKE